VKHLNLIDCSIIVVYFLILIVIGMVLRKRASLSLEDYFLGGRKMPWWALGISCTAGWLDMTGTMIITAFLFLLGPRGLYIEFRGGACLVLVFMMLWAGKWHRRSGVMTGAEWMMFRFGRDRWAHFARMSSVVATVIFTVGALAVAFKGAGLFLSMFLPFSPFMCTVIMMAVTIIYTLESGFYGVVVTDIFQTFCVWIAVAFIVILAAIKVSGGDFAAVAMAVTGNQEWTTTLPKWETAMPKGYENYSLLWMVGGFYLLKTIIQGMGAGADPRYFGARSDRECGLLSFMCGWLMMLRWPLMLGFAILGLFLMNQLFPDHSAIGAAAALIKANVGEIAKNQWPEVLSNIANNSSLYKPELITGLHQILGDDWQSKLSMVSFEGGINPERILPAVILYNIPVGLRGLILVSLIAGAMSSVNASINTASGFLTRDLYQGYIRPQAGNKELIYISYISGFLLVVISLAMAYSTESINHIWGWLMMGLSAGLVGPAALRLYWWRFNSGGYTIGMLVGITAALLQWFLMPSMPEWQQFVFIFAIGIAGSVVGTYITSPTEPDVTERFYKMTRPFGFWGPLKRTLPDDVRVAMEREHRNDIISLPFALGWMITLFLLPMQMLSQQWHAFWPTLGVFGVCLGGLYIFWYKNLPKVKQIAAEFEQHVTTGESESIRVK
jgi:SSS family solute:Na+ symporter